MKKKIAFVGFWNSFNYEQNLIYQLLCSHYDVEVCDAHNADYSICTLYNTEFLDASGIRIFYTAEAIAPDFTLFDYFIGFDELEFEDRYVRVPNYLMNSKYQEDISLMRERHFGRNNTPERFCSWVCSNGNGDKLRDVIFEKLCEYKIVDSAGCYRNNVGTNERLQDKRAFQKNYKFSLAVENTSYKGYTTEKLIEAFAAGGIPIYWGDPDVGRVFNTKAFVNLMDYPSIEKGVEVVKKLDQDDALYNEMLLQKALVDDGIIDNNINQLDRFLINIFDQPLEKAHRRPHGQTAMWAQSIATKGLTSPQEAKQVGIISKCRKYFKIR